MPNTSASPTRQATYLAESELKRRQAATRQVAARPNPWRLTPAARNTVLVLHVIMGISWMGVDIALFALLMTARTTHDASLVVSGFNAIGVIVPLAVPPLSLGILGTGLILGLGTRWGLIHYWWVLVKLLLSMIMTALVYLSLLPAIRGTAILSDLTLSADAVRASLGPLPTMLMFPPIVSFLMLATATILSIFKPWRRTPWSRESDAGPAKDV
jgi:hypothetical protein